MSDSVCNVVIMTDTYVGAPGGSERHLHNFLGAISSSFNVKVIQLAPTGNPMFEDGYLEGKVNVELSSIPLRSVGSVRFLSILFYLWRLIRREKIDLVVSYHEKSDILNYALKVLLPRYFVTVSSKRDMGFKLSPRLKKIMQYITPRLVNITAPSASIASQMIHDFHTSPERTHVIHNGVNLAMYKSTNESEKRELKKGVCLPLESRIMVSVGWLKPVKGHKYLLQAFARFKETTDVSWSLVLLGVGELESELKSLAGQLSLTEDILFAGYQENVSDWLGASDVLVSASLSEGLSNALVEGAATGLPLVATDVGGNPEVVEDGTNGILVKAEDVEGLTSALIKVANDKDRYQRMACASRQKAESQFSNEAMVSKLESLYLSLTGKDK